MDRRRQTQSNSYEVVLKFHVCYVIHVKLLVTAIVKNQLAGFSLQNEHHSKPAAPNLQHTTN